MDYKVFKIREPNLKVLYYEVIGCFLIGLGILPLLYLDPTTANVSLTGKLWGILTYTVFFLPIILLPTLFFINLFWAEFIFDEAAKKIFVVKHLFFFKFGKRVEIDFYLASLEITKIVYKDIKYSSYSEGYNWNLYLIYPNGYYELDSSLFKKPIEKKMKIIKEILSHTFKKETPEDISAKNVVKLRLNEDIKMGGT